MPPGRRANVDADVAKHSAGTAPSCCSRRARVPLRDSRGSVPPGSTPGGEADFWEKKELEMNQKWNPLNKSPGSFLVNVFQPQLIVSNASNKWGGKMVVCCTAQRLHSLGSSLFWRCLRGAAFSMML